ncbi:murein L,D-transpeptidase family protein [Novosphingobium sp.]|uniref:L,D-transpeptidase family protein n=1 Tax=Novosphingobium sp. TaxID=1874826 RepID=UPI0038BE0EB5
MPLSGRSGLLIALLLGSAARAGPPDDALDPARVAGATIASVLVEKAARRLTLFDADGRAVRQYQHIQLGREPLGSKRFEGDGRTPEGHYTIDFGNPTSAYHLSLHISYPDSRDRAFAAAAGRNPGGAIFLHGSPNGFSQRPAGDWTEGCIALDNREIEEIWVLVPDDTPIDILP